MIHNKWFILQTIPAVQVLVAKIGTTAGLLGNLLLSVVLGLPSLQHDSNLVVLNARSNNFFIIFLHPLGELYCTSSLSTSISLSKSICSLERFFILVPQTLRGVGFVRYGSSDLLETLPCRTWVWILTLYLHTIQNIVLLFPVTMAGINSGQLPEIQGPEFDFHFIFFIFFIRQPSSNLIGQHIQEDGLQYFGSWAVFLLFWSI